MGSPSSSLESLSVKRETSRLENLADLVFGLALSVCALSLLGSPPQTQAQIQTDILWFMFSFMILIHFWADYSDIMTVLPIETRATLLLTEVMLFLVVLQPYLLYLLNQSGRELTEYASTIYALDLGGLMVISAFFYQQLSIEEKKLAPQESLARYRRTRDFHLISAACFFLTILPQFWTIQIGGTPTRYLIWLAPLVVTWISRILSWIRAHARR